MPVPTIYRRLRSADWAAAWAPHPRQTIGQEVHDHRLASVRHGGALRALTMAFVANPMPERLILLRTTIAPKAPNAPSVLKYRGWILQRTRLKIRRLYRFV